MSKIILDKIYLSNSYINLIICILQIYKQEQKKSFLFLLHCFYFTYI